MICGWCLLSFLTTLLSQSHALSLVTSVRWRVRLRLPRTARAKQLAAGQRTFFLGSVGRQRLHHKQSLRSTGKRRWAEVANAAAADDAGPQEVPPSNVGEPAAFASPETAWTPTRAPRVYLGGANLHVGQIVQLSPEQTRYIVSVMRLRDGSPVRVFDGVNGEFLAAVWGTTNRGGSKGKRSAGGSRGADQVELRVEYLTRPQPRRGGGEDLDAPDVELIFAPIRKQRLKMLVEKAVELGATKLTPVLTARTQKGAAADANALCKLGLVTAVEAAEQCERMVVPHVGATPLTLASLLKELDVRRSRGAVGGSHSPCFAGAVEGPGGAEGNGREMAAENEGRLLVEAVFVCKERDVDAPPMLDALAEYARASGRDERHCTHASMHSSMDGSCTDSGGSAQGFRAAILVGPEGGFEPTEIRAMAAYPFVRFVSLGPTVLRAETAAMYALSCWSAFWAANRADSPR